MDAGLETTGKAVEDCQPPREGENVRAESWLGKVMIKLLSSTARTQNEQHQERKENGHANLKERSLHPWWLRLVRQLPLWSSGAYHQYIYSPLRWEDREIRVLVLEPGATEKPLQGHLLQMPLTSAADTGFETISYCWGDTNDRGTIQVNGYPLEVPNSAIQLLRQLRYEDKDRLLWLDSICLNQSNHEERSHEVARMCHIYSRGWRNLIWLGPDDDDATAASAFQFYRNAVAAIERVMENKLTLGLVLAIPSRMFVARYDPRSLFRLLSKQWFTRLWVLQEAALSRLNVVCCGKYTADFVDMLRVFMWLIKDDENRRRVSFGGVRRIWLAVMEMMSFVDPEFDGYKKRLWQAKLEPQDLSNLLRNYRDRDTTNPKDHVYGVLGLYQGLSDGVIPELLQPDYGKDVTTVFRDATRCAIYQARSLRILAEARHRPFDDGKCERGVLSWVPRWNRGWDPHLEEAGLLMDFDAGLGTSVGDGPERLKWCDHIDLQGLFVDGLDGAAVAQLSEIFTHNSDLGFLVDKVLGLLELTTASHLYRDHEEAVSRTLVAGGAIPSRKPSKSDAVPSFSHWQAHRQTHGEVPPQPHELSMDATDEETNISDYHAAVTTACGNRRFFTTAGGRMGLGPQTMRLGDVAVILYGGPWPFILRYHKDSDDYEFIGQCYIEGIMFGEAVEKHRAEGREDVIFHIL